jgi:hypothetical protein
MYVIKCDDTSQRPSSPSPRAFRWRMLLDWQAWREVMRVGKGPLGVVSIWSWVSLSFGHPLNLVLYMPPDTRQVNKIWILGLAQSMTTLQVCVGARDDGDWAWGNAHVHTYLETYILHQTYPASFSWWSFPLTSVGDLVLSKSRFSHTNLGSRQSHRLPTGRCKHFGIDLSKSSDCLHGCHGLGYQLLGDDNRCHWRR